jgi:hypothetical protein
LTLPPSFLNIRYRTPTPPSFKKEIRDLLIREIRRAGSVQEQLLAGCSKTLRYKAHEIPRSEAYMRVRRNDEG